MKKIMLINPYMENGLKGFPLGLAYLAGALRSAGYEVFCLDLTAIVGLKNRCENISYDSYESVLGQALKENQSDLVGITSTSPTHRNALDVARVVKRFANIPVIKGGPHETNCAETTIRNNPQIDYSVVGEGEETIIELIGAILTGKSAGGIKGVVYREGGEVVNNGRRALSDLSNLPIPARDLFYTNPEFEKYYSANLFEGKKSTSITTSRGCPKACSFCSSKASWGKFRQRTVDDVVRETERLAEQGFEGFSFEDDMSLFNKEWYLQFFSILREKGLKIKYSMQTRVDALDEEIAKVIKNSGCKMIYFGIESGVGDILKRCGKGITVKQAKKTFEIARKYGLRNMATIQFGLPGEDLSNLTTVRETIRVLNEELRPDEVAFSYTALYPGSPLANEAGVTPEAYEHYVKTRADELIHDKTAHGVYSIHPKGLTPEKIEEIEQIVKTELKIKRFDLETFYKT